MNPLGHIVSLMSSTLTSWCGREGSATAEASAKPRRGVAATTDERDGGGGIAPSASGRETKGSLVARALANAADASRRAIAREDIDAGLEGAYFFTGSPTFSCVCPGGSANPSTASLKRTTTLSGVICAPCTAVTALMIADATSLRTSGVRHAFGSQAT